MLGASRNGQVILIHI
jgi:WD40 repeat protein